MEGPTFSGEENFATNLKISSDLWTFLHSKIKDMEFKTSLIKENTSGRFSFTLEYDLIKDKVDHVENGKFHHHHDQTSRQFATSQRNTAPIPQPFSRKKKRKSPSRRKRDRERFRKFIASKRQRQRTLSTTTSQLSTSSPGSSSHSSESASCYSPSQCSSPRDEIVTHTEPPTVTLNAPDAPGSPSNTAISTSPEHFSADTPVSNREPQPCKCDICTKMATSPDLSTALYLECTFCATAASEVEGGLRPCSRCLMEAYCSKDCQSKDWKTHKTHCDKESADRIRKLRDEWSRMREVAKVHAERPDSRPPVS